MRVIAVCLASSVFALPGVCEVGESPWEVTQDSELAVLLAPGGSSEGGLERENALFEVGLGLSAERIFASGWTLGGRFVFRAARDHPARPAGAGNLILDPTQGPAGGFSRLSAGPEFSETGPRGSLETAYIFLDTGYGEFSAGRDTGVAARFHEGSVSVLTRGQLADPYLDASGIGALNTRPDVTGPSLKVSYVTPRLLGVRAGASYTPRAEVRGLDRDATVRSDPPRPELENTFEIGLNASRRLRESNLRLRAGASYATSELDVPATITAVYDDRIDVISFGGEAEWRDRYKFGLNWLSADEGLADGGDYTAWSAGFGYERGDWSASLTYGEAELDATGAEAEGFSIALARQVNDSFTVAVAWQDRDLKLQQDFLSTTGFVGAQSEGVVLEVTLDLENCVFSDC